MGSPIFDEDLQPAWEPNRRPVNFDYDLAAEATEQCRALARRLRELRARRIVRGDEVIEHWTGQYFLDWEPPHQTARKDELEMAEHLESLAAYRGVGRSRPGGRGVPPRTNRPLERRARGEQTQQTTRRAPRELTAPTPLSPLRALSHQNWQVNAPRMHRRDSWRVHPQGV